MRWATLILIGLILWGSMGLLLIVGAVKMMRLKSYNWAVFASILAFLPCSPANLLGIAMGIWSLIVLNRPDVKEAFRVQGNKHAINAAKT